MDTIRSTPQPEDETNALSIFCLTMLYDHKLK